MSDPKDLGIIAVFSCVGGGPMARLVEQLRARGADADVVEELSPERWRQRMSAGKLGRLGARLSATAVFPARAVGFALSTISSGRAGTMVPTTNPFFLPFVFVATRPLHGQRVVPLVYDLYPDALEASGLASERGLVARLAEAANRYWLSHADGVVFIGEYMAAHARQRYGEPRRTAVIETGASLAEFSSEALGPNEPESELERWCEGKRVVSYVGNMGHMHDWETLARAIPAVLEATRDQPVGIVIAASGPGVERLREAWSDLPASRVRFEAPLPDRAWARLLSRTDIAVVTLRESAAETSIPSKTFSSMAAGSAIVAVAPASSDVARLVERHGCGPVVSPGDVTSLRDALLELLSDDGQLRRAQEASQKAMREHYDLTTLAARWLAFLDEVHVAPPDRRGQDAARRAIDVVGAAIGLVATAPLQAVAAAAIRTSLGKPVLFRQQRPGKDGRPFELLKFRTMRHPRPGEQGPDSDAARLTRLGRLLRATSIDELPALWNVLRGDMSLVGPRPLLMRYLPRYTKRQARRHEVKPGITGWAQVNGRNALSWEEKFEHDVWYVDNRSLWLDLQILAMTVVRVLKREGISADGHATMAEFLGTPDDGVERDAPRGARRRS